MSERECFVYIQLPLSLTLVTCGKYVRETVSDGRVVGRFVYGRVYREQKGAVPLDPYHLPLSPITYQTTKLDGVFGALRDASPDAWGRRVIEKIVGKPGLDEMDYLLQGPEDRTGALSFGLGVTPPAPVRAFNRTLQLRELKEAARILEELTPGEEVPDSIRHLVDPGSSLGGARPKNVVEDDEGLWVAKFPQRRDRWNHAAVEAGMLTLAAQCGIRVPDVRVESVGGDSVLLVKRFDRQRVDGGYRRHRFVSALTVLDAEDKPTDRANWSYLLLADELQRWSVRPAEDRAELFRRVAFNALISNTDDHPRNHALIAPGVEWQLAPAYDMTPSPSYSVERRDLTLVCGEYGRMARRDNLLSAAPRFGLERERAAAIIDEIRAMVERAWRGEVRRHGGTDADCVAVETAFCCSGFDYATEPER